MTVEGPAGCPGKGGEEGEEASPRQPASGPVAPVGGPASRSNVCPQCQQPRVIPIVYGYPNADTLAAATRGEVYLGGCSPDAWLPEWHCAACGHQWLAEAEEQQELEELEDYVRRHLPRKP